MFRHVLAVAALASLLGSGSAAACDACQDAFRTQILRGESASVHARELARLARGERAPAALDPRAASPERLASAADAGPAVPARSLPPTSWVPPGTKPDRTFEIEMSEGETFIGNGVVYKGFLIDGKIPGPTLVVDEGDVVEFTVVNKGTVPHGVSIHAAYTQTSKYFGKIPPGERRTHLFRASYPGVFLYHCAPGGHAIPIHVLLGQYGMIVVRPKTHRYRMEEILGKKPDVEIHILQHELYANGKDAVEGRPAYVLFNGKLFRYAETPIVARPGDFVRIYFLNVGPNQISTFHIVGIIWDFAYWQGMPNPETTFVGGQSVLAGPTDSWIVDFRVPEDEGSYLMLNHAVGPTTRGSIGILLASTKEERTPVVLPDGPSYTAEERATLREKAARVISPFEPGSDELAHPWRLPAGESLARVTIIGNSFFPKVIEIPVGTEVEWTNEDVFTFFEGEFSGIHNVAAFAGPELFASPMLAHAERFRRTFTKAGEYPYLCTPHPYMRGIVRVVERSDR